MPQPRSPAQRFDANRGRFCVVFSGVALMWTIILVLQVHEGSAHWITALAWVVWLLMPTVWTFGLPRPWAWSSRERAMLNDELVREHQRAAATTAMWILAAGAIVACVPLLTHIALPLWWPVATLGSGLCAAGFRFGWLQMRADA